MTPTGPRNDYSPVIVDITDDDYNLHSDLPVSRKRKAISGQDDDYTSDGYVPASTNVSTDAVTDGPTDMNKGSPGSVRNEPCLACVSRGTKRPGFECHDQNNSIGKRCWQCAKDRRSCDTLPAQVRDVVLEFWAINRSLPSEHIRTWDEVEQSRAVKRAIKNRGAEYRKSAITGVTASPRLPPPPSQPATAKVSARETAGPEDRLTAAIQAHKAAVRQQTEVLRDILDSVQQAVDQMTNMTNELRNSRQSQPGQFH